MSDHESLETADSVVGCVRCAKPAALVGDMIPRDGLCPWCRDADAPGVAKLRSGDVRARIAELEAKVIEQEEEVKFANEEEAAMRTKLARLERIEAAAREAADANEYAGAESVRLVLAINRLREALEAK